jgi:hypothetical protein
MADYPVECPHCDSENDLGPDWYDGFSQRSPTLEWECEVCGKFFDVLVEFEPIFTPMAQQCGPKVPWDHPSHPSNVWRRAQEAANAGGPDAL